MSTEQHTGGDAASGDVYDRDADGRPAAPATDGSFPTWAAGPSDGGTSAPARPAMPDGTRTVMPDGGRPAKPDGGRPTPPLGQPVTAGTLAADWASSLPTADRGAIGPLPAPGAWPGPPPGPSPAFGPATLPPPPRTTGPPVKPVARGRRAEARGRTRRPSFRRSSHLADRIGFWRRLRSVVEIVFVTAVLGVLLAGVIAVVVGAIVLALQKALR